jgi:hypothetical protein
MFRKIKVTEGNKSLDVYVPKTDDRIEARDLEQFAIGKTKEDLRTKEIFNRKRKQTDKKEVAEYLKDVKAYDDRKRSGTKRFY